MNALELISKDGKHVELYINGEKQDKIFALTLEASVDSPVVLKIERYV